MTSSKLETSRPSGVRPVAIVDIGSNSVRLVTYDRLDRAPIPAFNEKSLCGLGNGVVTTGKLPKAGIDKALVALRRFRVLMNVMGVEDARVIATAAVRDAANGQDFVKAARDAIGHEVMLLTGPQEAKLAAYGVLSGVYEPDGVVGDLGGGSLELIDVGRNDAGPLIGEGRSLPLGGLALMDASSKSLKAASKIVREALARCHALDALEGRSFYAVGGTWRALAKLHMGRRGYPLMVMHGYMIPAREATALAGLADAVDAESIPSIDAVSAARRPFLAYGAVVLDELVRRGKPKNVVISTYGVREGLLYDALDTGRRAEDPLVVAARKLNKLLARAPDFAQELIDWKKAFLASAGLSESCHERRLREAACYLCETNWRAHPDYRGVQGFNLVSSAILPGVDHAERSFLSLIATLRYVGFDEEIDRQVRGLMPAKMIERACVLAALIRVASVLAAGMPGVLDDSPLAATTDKVELLLPPRFADLANDRLANRVKALAKLLGREPVVSVA